MDTKLEHAMGWLAEGAIAPDADVDPRGVIGNDDMNRRAEAMREAFRTPAGQLALETVLRMTLFRPPVDHRLQGALYRQFAQLREGQNQAAAGILAYLAHADQLEKARNDHRTRPEPRSLTDDAAAALAVGTGLADLGAGLTLRAPAEPGPDDFGGSAGDPFVAVC